MPTDGGGPADAAVGEDRGHPRAAVAARRTRDQPLAVAASLNTRSHDGKGSRADRRGEAGGRELEPARARAERRGREASDRCDGRRARGRGKIGREWGGRRPGLSDCSASRATIGSDPLACRWFGALPHPVGFRKARSRSPCSVGVARALRTWQQIPAWACWRQSCSWSVVRCARAEWPVPQSGRPARPRERWTRDGCHGLNRVAGTCQATKCSSSGPSGDAAAAVSRSLIRS